jgi:predicted metal-dependent enzyme (double-stranded beta helix superfamily)
VEPGEVLVLGADAAHDVHTPPARWSAALHVYLGDISTANRAAWSGVDASQLPFDGEEQERHWRQAALATELMIDSSCPL